MSEPTAPARHKARRVACAVPLCVALCGMLGAGCTVKSRPAGRPASDPTAPPRRAAAEEPPATATSAEASGAGRPAARKTDDAEALPAGRREGKPKLSPPTEPEREPARDEGPVLHVTPEGAGRRDGSDWANALPGAGLEAAWEGLPPGGRCLLGSGEYRGLTLGIASGGAGPDRMKRLVGADTGRGAPVLLGTWKKEDKGKGAPCIRLSKGVSWVEIRGLTIRKHRDGIYTSSSEGRHVGLRIADVAIEESRDALTLAGGAPDDAPELGSHDIVVRNCRFMHYTKRALRIRGGCYDVRVVDCVADAGGKEWFVEAFPVGFNVMGEQGVPKGSAVTDHDITFVNCTSRGNYHENGKKYWNADGFCVERPCYGIRYYRCRAFDNTDGGWDDKSRDPLVVGCVAFRNKRNFRFWSRGEARLLNCIAGFAMKRGGSGGADGLWASGNVRASRCTFHNNRTGISASGRPRASSSRTASSPTTRATRDGPPASRKADASRCRAPSRGPRAAGARTQASPRAPTRRGRARATASTAVATARPGSPKSAR